MRRVFLIRRTVSAMLIAVLLCVTSGCSSVTLRPKGGDKDLGEPTYLDSKAFYLWGLVGEHKVDVNEVCEGADVLQMQSVTTLSDYLIGFVTLFIYAPRTAKVWCDEE